MRFRKLLGLFARVPGKRPSMFLARALAVLAAFLITGLFVVRGTQAAFTDTTDNTANSISAGTVALVDDDLAVVLFNVSAMSPGDSVTNCIVVTYQGTISNPVGVKLYSSGYVDSANLADYLNVTIEEGTGGSFGSCAGFTLENTIESGGDLIAFNTAHTDYASGAGVWDPSGTPEPKTYRFTLALDAATPDSEQAASVTALAFTWEVHSN